MRDKTAFEFQGSIWTANFPRKMKIISTFAHSTCHFTRENPFQLPKADSENRPKVIENHFFSRSDAENVQLHQTVETEKQQHKINSLWKQNT